MVHLPILPAKQGEAVTTADVLDAVRGRAVWLSDAIKEANTRGIKVSLEKAPEGSDDLFQLIFLV